MKYEEIFKVESDRDEAIFDYLRTYESVITLPSGKQFLFFKGGFIDNGNGTYTRVPIENIVDDSDIAFFTTTE